MGKKTAEQLTEGMDASHLTIMVTGGTNGLGKETVRVLAKRGARVYLAARNLEAAYAVKEDILKEIPGARIDLLRINLASLESVRTAAEEFLGLNVPLHVLLCNAGILSRTGEFSGDGVELDFATNYLGHFLLTHLLLDKMKETATASGIEGRIVNVSSDAYWAFSCKEGIQFDQIYRPKEDNVEEKKPFNRRTSYGQSKLAQILYTKELAKRLQDEGFRNVTVNSLHPGLVRTNILGRHPHMCMRALVALTMKSFAKTVAQGACSQIYLAISPDVKGVSGKYFRGTKFYPLKGKHASDEELQTKLWDFSFKLTSA